MKKDVSASFKQSTVLPWIELRVANQSTACYDAHSHDEFSFGIIQQGSAAYKNRGKRHQIVSGDIVTINPADVHSCNPDRGTWSYSMLFAHTLTMGAIQKEVVEVESNASSHDYLAFNNDYERAPYLRSRYLALFNSLVSEQPKLHVQSCLFDFVAASMLAPKAETSVKGAINPVKRVREKLLDEITAAHELDTLAQEAGMSRYQLLRAFKNHYGLPPYAYLMDEKIKRSKQMLKEGQPLAEVALQLGFSDQAHFQRQFKKRLAVTPKYYQSHFVLS